MWDRAARKNGRKAGSSATAAQPAGARDAQESRKVHAVDIVFGAAPRSATGRRKAAAPGSSRAKSASASAKQPQEGPLAVRKRRAPVPKPYTPAAVAGRQHAAQQLDTALEPLTQAELAAFGTTQTDESGSLPPPTPPQRQRRETSGRSAAAAASGCDIGTQLTDTELPSFDAEVEPILDVVVDCALHEGMLAAARGFERQSGGAATTGSSHSGRQQPIPRTTAPQPVDIADCGRSAAAQLPATADRRRTSSAAPQFSATTGAWADASATEPDLQQAAEQPPAEPSQCFDPAAAETNEQKPGGGRDSFAALQLPSSSGTKHASDDTSQLLAAAARQTEQPNAETSEEPAAAQYVLDATKADQAADAANRAAAVLQAGESDTAADEDADAYAQIATASEAQARPSEPTASADVGAPLQETLQAAPVAADPGAGSSNADGLPAGSGSSRRLSSSQPGTAEAIATLDGAPANAGFETASISHAAAAAPAAAASSAAALSETGNTSLPAQTFAAMAQPAGQQDDYSQKLAAGSAAGVQDQLPAELSAAESGMPDFYQSGATPPALFAAAASAVPEMGSIWAARLEPEAALQQEAPQQDDTMAPAPPQAEDDTAGAASGFANVADPAAADSQEPGSQAAPDSQPLARDFVGAAADSAAEHVEDRRPSESQLAALRLSEAQLARQQPEAQPLREQRLDLQPSNQQQLSRHAVAEEPAVATSCTDWSSLEATSVSRPGSARSSGSGGSRCGSDGSSGPDASDTGAAKLPSLEWLLLDAASCGGAASGPHTPQTAENAAAAEADLAGEAGPAAEAGPLAKAAGPSAEEAVAEGTAAPTLEAAASAALRAGPADVGQAAVQQDAAAPEEQPQALTGDADTAAGSPPESASRPLADLHDASAAAARQPLQPLSLTRRRTLSASLALPEAPEAAQAAADQAQEQIPPGRSQVEAAAAASELDGAVPSDTELTSQPTEAALRSLESADALDAAEEPTSGLRDGSRTANLTDLQLRGPDGTNTAPASDEDTVSNASEVAQSQQLGGAPPTAAAADEDSAAAVAALPLQEQQPAAGQPPRRASRTMARAQDASQPASSSADAEDTAAQADGRPGQATNAAAPWAGSGGSVAAAIDEANADIVGAAGRNAQPPAAKEALNDEAAALELPAAPAAEEAPQSMATAAADADSRVAADEGSLADDAVDAGSGDMAPLLAFVSPEFVTPRHSDEGGAEPPRYLLFSPGMESSPEEPPDAATAAGELRASQEASRAEAPDSSDAGHILPVAGTANFGVTAVAAIPEPRATAAAERARRLIGSSVGSIVTAMADGGNPTDVEEPQPSEDPHQDPRPADGSSTTDVEDPQPADGSGGLAEPDTENAAASAVHGSVARGSRQKPADADDSEAKHSVASRWARSSSHATWLLDAAAAAVVAALDTEDPSAAAAASEAAARAAAQSPDTQQQPGGAPGSGTDASAGAACGQRAEHPHPAVAAVGDTRGRSVSPLETEGDAVLAAARQHGGRAYAAETATHSSTDDADTAEAELWPAPSVEPLPAAESAVAEQAAFVHVPAHHQAHHRLLALPTIYESEDVPADGRRGSDAAAGSGMEEDAEEAAGEGAADATGERRPFNWPIVWPSPGTF